MYTLSQRKQEEKENKEEEEKEKEKEEHQEEDQEEEEEKGFFCQKWKQCSHRIFSNILIQPTGIPACNL